MKNQLFAFAFCCLTSGYTLANEPCTTQQTENGIDTKVIDADGVYLGYVSPNQDGSYFIWLEGRGSLNESKASYEDAVEFVCKISPIK